MGTLFMKGFIKIRKPISCGHIMSAKLWPPPPLQRNSIFYGHRKKQVFFIYFLFTYISIDSEWSKMYDFESKIKNNAKYFLIHIFTFQNILPLFLLQEKKYFNCGQGVTPPPKKNPFADMSVTDMCFLLTPSLTNRSHV